MLNNDDDNKHWRTLIIDCHPYTPSSFRAALSPRCFWFDSFGSHRFPPELTNGLMNYLSINHYANMDQDQFEWCESLSVQKDIFSCGLLAVYYCELYIIYQGDLSKVMIRLIGESSQPNYYETIQWLKNRYAKDVNDYAALVIS